MYTALIRCLTSPGYLALVLNGDMLSEERLIWD